jgi:hypothetical protein
VVPDNFRAPLKLKSQVVGRHALDALDFHGSPCGEGTITGRRSVEVKNWKYLSHRGLRTVLSAVPLLGMQAEALLTSNCSAIDRQERLERTIVAGSLRFSTVGLSHSNNEPMHFVVDLYQGGTRGRAHR